MTSPMNDAGSQRTFWNTYAFHPSEAKTRQGRFASALGAVALGIFTLGLGHALSYFIARRPFQAKYRDFMTESLGSLSDTVDGVKGRSSPFHNSSSESDSNDTLKKYDDLVKKESQLYDELKDLEFKRNAYKMQDIPLDTINAKIESKHEAYKHARSNREDYEKTRRHR